MLHTNRHKESENIIRVSVKKEMTEPRIATSARIHRLLDIENALTYKNGADVKLKKGSHVEITATAGSNKFNRCDFF